MAGCISSAAGLARWLRHPSKVALMEYQGGHTGSEAVEDSILIAPGMDFGT
jgi:hypothetical protein